MRTTPLIHILAVVSVLVVPCVGLASGPQYAGATADLLNPGNLFDILKRNITIPINTEQNIEILTPEQALEKSSPQLQEVNKDVKTETGIDLAKFISWFAGMLKLVFQIVVDLLDNVAKSLDPNQ